MNLGVISIRDGIIEPAAAACPQVYYYSAIVEDVLLRFSWTLNITLTTVVKGHGMGDILATVLAPMEVFRYLHPLTCLHLPFCCLFCPRPRVDTWLREWQ